MDNTQRSPSLLKPAYETALVQLGVGSLCGHLINAINQFMHPGKVILGVPPASIISPFQAGLCSLVYAVVDRIAITLLKSKDNEQPVTQALRMAVVLTISAGLTSACLGITFNVAAGTILASIIATTLLLGAVKAYNQLVHT
jgi:hypothetical protein